MRYSAANTISQTRYRRYAAHRHLSADPAPEMTEAVARTQIAGLLVNLDLARRHGLNADAYAAKIAALVADYPALASLAHEEARA